MLKRLYFSQPYSWLLVLFVSSCALLVLSSCAGLEPNRTRQQDLKNPEQSATLLEQIHSRGKLVAGVKFDSPPFGYLTPQGEVKGFDVDLIHELARRILGNPNAVEFQQVLSSTRIIALNAGNVDIIAATMTITPEREKFIDFSQVYYQAGQAVLVPDNSTIHTSPALTDKTILFVIGSTGEKTIKKRFPDAHFVGFRTPVEAFSALKAGRGDALTTDDTILSGLMMNHCGFRLLPERLSKEPYGLGIRQDEPSFSTQGFLSRVNRELEQMEKDGTMSRLKQKWLAPLHTSKPVTPSACKPDA